MAPHAAAHHPASAAPEPCSQVYSHSLVPPNPLVDRSHHIRPQHKPDRFPRVPVPVVPVLHDPVERDKAIVQPSELEEDREEHDDGCVDEKGVERAFERDGVFEEGELDGDAVP